MTKKECTNCAHKKQLSEFHKDNRSLDKRQSICKKCRAERYNPINKQSHKDIGVLASVLLDLCLEAGLQKSAISKLHDIETRHLKRGSQ